MDVELISSLTQQVSTVTEYLGVLAIWLLKKQQFYGAFPERSEIKLYITDTQFCTSKAYNHKISFRFRWRYKKDDLSDK